MHFSTLLLVSTAAFVQALPFAPNSNGVAPASPRDFPYPHKAMSGKRVLDAQKRQFIRRKSSGSCGASTGSSSGAVSHGGPGPAKLPAGQIQSPDGVGSGSYGSGSYGNSTASYTFTGTASATGAIGMDSTETATTASESASGAGGQLLAPHHTTKQTNAVTATTTTSTATETSSQGSGSSGGGNVLDSSGIATFFTQNGNAGACGNYNPDSFPLIALATSQYNNGANCGKTVTITASNGVTKTATVQDECPPCEAGHIDMSTGLWDSFGYPTSDGIFDVTWECHDCVW